MFGRRLQTQIVKEGERVVMDVEITGLPEPHVKWFKDQCPISADHPRYKLQQLGNCHKLIIDSSELISPEFMFFNYYILFYDPCSHKK